MRERRTKGGATVALLAALLALPAGCGQGGPAGPAGDVPPGGADAAPVASDAGLDPAARADVLAQAARTGLLALDARALAPDAVPGAGDDAARARAALGPAAPPIAESLRPIDRRSPEALVGTALGALTAGDVAALARLGHPRWARPVLDADDADDARRRFLGPATRPAWERVARALAAGAARLEHTPGATTARLHVDVGGALGTQTIRLRREEDGWYLDS